MTATTFFDPQARPLSTSGAIMPGCTYTFFLTETTTPADVYSDADLSTSLGSIVTADADGRFVTFYLDASLTYRVQLHDEDGVLINDVDPYYPPRDFQPGTVVLFYGTSGQRDAAYPSSLWAVLDGNNGTPNGLERYIRIAGGGVAVGATGGADSVNSSAAGAHDHGGATEETILDSNDMPVHHHRLFAFNTSSVDGRVDGFALAGNDVSVAGERNAGGAYIDNNGFGTQVIENSGTVTPTGHDHGIAEQATHTHTVATLSPYVALWALMRKYP